MHCISLKGSLRAKHFCALTSAESRTKIRRQLDEYKPPPPHHHPQWLWLLSVLMLRLHYVPGGHGSHDFGHRGRNGVTVTQRRGTGSTNVARRGCRDRRDRFLNSQKICHGSHGGIDLLKCAVVQRGERNKT